MVPEDDPDGFCSYLVGLPAAATDDCFGPEGVIRCEQHICEECLAIGDGMCDEMFGNNGYGMDMAVNKLTKAPKPNGERSCDEGYLEDCSGDGDCCEESWLGDGYADCADQEFGCDLSCYDNDGGDCAPVITCEEQGLVTCADGSCATSEGDCPLVAGCGPTGECPDGTYFDGFSCYDCSYCLEINDDSVCDAPEDCCGMCGGSVDGGCDGTLSSNDDGTNPVEDELLDYSIAENLKYLSYLNSINTDNQISGGEYSADMPNNIDPNWFTESRV